MNNENFIKVNRGLFQNNKILNNIKQETGTKQINIIFATYVVLELKQNRFGVTTTSLDDIENYIYNSSATANINKIREALKVLKQYEIIDIEIDIDKINKVKVFECSVNEYEQFMKLYKEDIELLKKLDSNFFLIYCNVNNFQNDEKGYSFVSYETLEQLQSSKTISRHLDIAYALEIFDITTLGDGWVYSKDRGKAIRSNNMYAKNVERIKELANMSKEEIQGLIDSGIDNVSSDKYKANIYRWLAERELSYDTESVNGVLKELTEQQTNYILDKVKVSDKNIEDKEFNNALIIYHYNKYIAKEFAIAKEQDKAKDTKQDNNVDVIAKEEVVISDKSDVVKESSTNIVDFVTESIIANDKYFKISAKQISNIEEFVADYSFDVFKFAMLEAKKEIENSNFYEFESNVHKFNVVFKNATTKQAKEAKRLAENEQRKQREEEHVLSKNENELLDQYILEEKQIDIREFESARKQVLDFIENFKEFTKDDIYTYVNGEFDNKMKQEVLADNKLYATLEINIANIKEFISDVVKEDVFIDSMNYASEIYNNNKKKANISNFVKETEEVICMSPSQVEEYNTKVEEDTQHNKDIEKLNKSVSYYRFIDVKDYKTAMRDINKFVAEFEEFTVSDVTDFIDTEFDEDIKEYAIKDKMFYAVLAKEENLEMLESFVKRIKHIEEGTAEEKQEIVNATMDNLFASVPKETIKAETIEEEKIGRSINSDFDFSILDGEEDDRPSWMIEAEEREVRLEEINRRERENSLPF